MKDLHKLKAIPVREILTVLCKKHSVTGRNPVCPVCNSGAKVNNTSAFNIYRKTNSWYCFSCSTGGDAIRLVEKVNGINFKEACQFLEENFYINNQNG